MTRIVRNSAIIFTTAIFLYWLSWLYDTALRDPRFLDGWLLVAGIGLQVYFHVLNKVSAMSPRTAVNWQQTHIYLGWLLLAVFALHTSHSLPDTMLEWSLWTLFVSISLSGAVGTYFSWSVPGKMGLINQIPYEQIPGQRSELAQEIHSLATKGRKQAPMGDVLFSPLPYDDWIADLYKNHLNSFLVGPQNMIAHLRGSQRHLAQLTNEIENLKKYVDEPRQAKLDTIKELVIKKDRLDFAYAHQRVMKLWLFVHVPATYALVVLALVHISVVYAFSSGAP